MLEGEWELLTCFLVVVKLEVCVGGLEEGKGIVAGVGEEGWEGYVVFGREVVEEAWGCFSKGAEDWV